MPEPEGFRFDPRQDGVWLFARGRHVVTLRGGQARRFLERVGQLPEAERQHLMARATGNYRRGNERPAPS